MIEEAEIVCILEKSKEVLKKYPELKEMNPKEALAYLTEKKVDYDYLGVLSYLYMRDIESLSYKSLLSYLAKLDTNDFLCIHIAYILQKEYGISLVKLLIEIYDDDTYQKISPFVRYNLLFEESLEIENVEKFLAVVYENKDQENRTLLLNFVKLIIRESKHQKVFELFLKNTKVIYLEFIHYFCSEVYRMNHKIGNEMLEIIMEKKGVGIEAIASEFLCNSVFYGFSLFEEYFDKIHQWMEGKIEIRKILIPTYMRYIGKGVNDYIKENIFEELEKIPFGTVEEKKVFLDTIVYTDIGSDELNHIFEGILNQSINKNKEILNLLSCYYYKIECLSVLEILQQLQQVFDVNEYYNDYKDFFLQFNKIFSKLKNQQEVVFDYFLRSILTAGTNNFYFALGLYEYLIDINSITANCQKRNIELKEFRLIIQGILYFTFNTKKLCRFSFELIHLIPEIDDIEPYLKVCIDEIYENYSYTYWLIATEQKNHYNKWGKLLKERIIERYENYQLIQGKARNILDLRPSEERSRLYRKALIEQNKKLNRKVDEKSFWAQMFQKRFMKYGKRHAGIQHVDKERYSYHVTPYMETKVEIEQQNLSVKHPVEWIYLKLEYFKERENYCAIGN